MSKNNLILLHGALGSSKSFDGIIQYLQRNYNLIVPDLNWHGSRAEANASFTMDDLANDLEAVFQHHKIQSAHVFGFSMGGYVALTLAKLKPQYFKSIMTLGTKLDWNPQQAEQESKMLNPDKIKEKVPQFAKYLEGLHGKNWNYLCMQTAEMMIDLGNNPILTTENISTIEIPVRLGLGDRDNMVSLDETISFFKTLLNGELQVFPKCSHPIEKINSDLLAQAIIHFLE
jgi:pimeloyl-ACP methyl ester carboxylesterase